MLVFKKDQQSEFLFSIGGALCTGLSPDSADSSPILFCLFLLAPLYRLCCALRTQLLGYVFLQRPFVHLLFAAQG